MQRLFISIVSLVFLISCAENSEDISSEQKIVSQTITPTSAPAPSHLPLNPPQLLNLRNQNLKKISQSHLKVSEQWVAPRVDIRNLEEEMLWGQNFSWVDSPALR